MPLERRDISNVALRAIARLLRFSAGSTSDPKAELWLQHRSKHADAL